MSPHEERRNHWQSFAGVRDSCALHGFYYVVMGSIVRQARGLLELSGGWEAAQLSLFHALEVFLWIEECTHESSVLLEVTL
jgi:hypothetical protein